MNFERRLGLIEQSPEVRVALALDGKLPLEELDRVELEMIIAGTPPALHALHEKFFTLLTDEEFTRWDTTPLEKMRPQVRAVAEEIIAWRAEHETSAATGSGK